MAADGQIRERVYREIKRRLVEGELALDQHLDLTNLSKALRASPTPLKEALVRLTGERLLVAKGKGFNVARWTTAQLRALYQWREKLFVLSLEALTAADLPKVDPAGVYAKQVRSILEAAAAAGGDELAFASANADDRLGYARLVEPELWPDVFDELAALRGALIGSDRTTGVDAGRKYFGRRIDAAQSIRDCAVLRSHPNGS